MSTCEQKSFEIFGLAIENKKEQGTEISGETNILIVVIEQARFWKLSHIERIERRLPKRTEVWETEADPDSYSACHYNIIAMEMALNGWKRGLWSMRNCDGHLGTAEIDTINLIYENNIYVANIITVKPVIDYKNITINRMMMINKLLL